MTSPTGGGGQNINLAALWIPVLPDTSHIGDEMRKAGSEAKTKFEQGFNSAGSSPEQLSQSYMSRMTASMSRGFSELEIPFGVSKVSKWFDQFSNDVDQKVVGKLRGQATEALRAYGAEHEKLAAAQNRVTEAENKLNVARDNGINKASIVLPLLTEQTAAHKALEEQTARTTTAHDQLSSVTGKLNEEQGKATSGGQIMAGVMGGLVVVGAGLALKAVEAFADFLKEGLEAGIEVTKELAVQTIELGSKYEEIGIGIREFSNASGEAFDSLESRAQRVFGTLDVAGANTGQTFGQLTSVLGEAIPDSLIKHIEELQGRFSNLKAQDVASIFYDFKVPAEETDSVLASLAESARSSGQGLGDLVSALKGEAAETLKEAGLNAQQAGAFMADLLKLGAGGRSVMTGLQTAMKDFGKEGLSFGDGMKLAGQRLKELGDTAEGQDLAEKLFGTRRWAIAMQAVQDYVDVVGQGPEAFNRSADSLDLFLTQTETLGNKWEMVKHKAEDAFSPIGKAGLSLLGTGLDRVTAYVDTHMATIRESVKHTGENIIRFGAETEQIATGLLGFFRPIISAMLEMFGESLQYMGSLEIAAANFLRFVPGMKDQAKDMAIGGGNAIVLGHQMKTNVKQDVDNSLKSVEDWLHKHPIDIDAAIKKWDEFADHVATDADKAKGAVLDMPDIHMPTVFGQTADFPASNPSPGSPGGPPTFGQGGKLPPVKYPHAMGRAYMGGGGPEEIKALAQQMFPWDASEWDAFDKLEMSEAGYDPHARNKSGAFGLGQGLGHEKDAYAGFYSQNPQTQLQTMFQYIADRYGTPSAAWAYHLEHNNYAAGGVAGMHPGKPSGTDTVPAWLTPGERIFDVETSRKFQALFDAIHGGMLSPSMLPPGVGKGGDDDGSIRGRLVPHKAFQFFGQGGDVLHLADTSNTKSGVPQRRGWLHDPWSGGTWAQWGPESGGPYMPPDNASGGDSGWLPWPKSGKGLPHKDVQYYGQGTDVGGVSQVIWSDLEDPTVQSAHGDAGVGALHGANVSGGPGSAYSDETNSGGQGFAGHHGHVHTTFNRDPFTGQPYNQVKAGTNTAAGEWSAFPPWVKKLGDMYGLDAKTYAGHQEWDGANHGIDWWPRGKVDMSGKSYTHQDDTMLSNFASAAIAVGTGKMLGFAGGSGAWDEPPGSGAPGSTPGGRNGGLYPGMPGQYGGGGYYGGETTDQQFSTAQAVQEAHDRASDLDTEIAKQQRHIKDLKDEIAAIGTEPGKTGLLTGQPLADPKVQAEQEKKRKQLNEQLDDATTTLTRTQRERSEQDGKISNAERKQQEAMYKKPSGTGQSAEGKAGETLGQGLLAGIGQELGLGDVLGKSPLDWGIVKLATGLLNYANNLGDAVFGKSGGFGTPGGSEGIGGGVATGLLGSLGIKLPKASISAGPNVVPGTPPIWGRGSEADAATPPVINNDNSIHVSADVSDKKVMAPVQAHRNSSNSAAFQYSGGFPAP